MLQRLLKRSQNALLAFYSHAPRVGIQQNGNNAEPDELAILGGLQSIINSRPASESLAAQSTISSGATPDSNQPNAAANFDITAGAAVPAPAPQNGDNLDLSTFFMNHDAGGEQQEILDWPVFDTPSFENELSANFLPIETYTQNSAVYQNYGLQQGDHSANMIPGNEVIWSMFANQLLP